MDRRFAILGDIHSNLDAFNAVIEDARSQGVTDFVFVGDIVGYNANPGECIEIARELGGVCVRGNHDHYCSHDEMLEDFQPVAASVIAWTRRQLTDEQGDWLSELPLSRIAAGFTLVHSTLDLPDRWGYVFDLLDAEAHFNYQTTTLCFHGHTHVPVIFERRSEVIRVEPCRMKTVFGAKYFINVGSVGQPRDGDPRSSYVIYNPKIKEIEFRRVAYDVQAAIEKLRLAGLPERLAQRLDQGR
ncbi:MAG: metallophosphoesterase family protein [Kiritimatiellae bacterium]|nr:metallophosphoesterase family protein [Kiritimatiellia bacterium]